MFHLFYFTVHNQPDINQDINDKRSLLTVTEKTAFSHQKH